MKFVSIDSSLTNTGIALGNIVEGILLVEEIHLISSPKSDAKTIRKSSDTISRCRNTIDSVHEILGTHKPRIIFAETPSGSQSASGMLSYGTTCMLIASLNPPAVEVTPSEVKMAIFGRKDTSKRVIIDWAYSLYPNLNWFFHGGKLQNKNEHMADAIAIARAGINTPTFKQIYALDNYR